jgi:hypothetical protein
MEGYIESIASNPFVTIGSFFLALISIVLAIIFYFRSQKEKIPCFESSSNTIIDGLHKSLEGLEIHYKGSKQERVTITKVAFWNAGKETIDKSDLIEKDPLCIICPKTADILDIQLTDVSSESNSVVVSDQTEKDALKYFTLSFEYLDHEEYFVAQLIHNGSSEDKFNVAGKIKGVKSIEHNTGSQTASSSSRIFRFLPFFGSIEMFINLPIILKYLGSIGYFSGGLFALWHLITGKTNWYVWIGAIFCFWAAGVIYYGFRHVSPAKI